MKKLKTFLRNLARRVGVELSGFDPRFHLEARKLELIRNPQIATFFDVGANTGQFAAWLRGAGYRGAIHSFEPGLESFLRLDANAESDDLWTVHRIALGAEPGRLELHLAADPTSSSLRLPTPANIAAHSCVTPVGVEIVPVGRLDELARKLVGNPTDRFAIKIDTQGFEEEVILGALGILDRVGLMVVEFSLEEMYEGQKLFHELLPWVRGFGFYPAIIEPSDMDYANHQILQVDVWFLKGRGIK